LDSKVEQAFLPVIEKVEQAFLPVIEFILSMPID
jgi:hypothetical protein